MVISSIELDHISDMSVFVSRPFDNHNVDFTIAVNGQSVNFWVFGLVRRKFSTNQPEELAREPAIEQFFGEGADFGTRTWYR